MKYSSVRAPDQFMGSIFKHQRTGAHLVIIIPESNATRGSNPTDPTASFPLVGLQAPKRRQWVRGISVGLSDLWAASEHLEHEESLTLRRVQGSALLT